MEQLVRDDTTLIRAVAAGDEQALGLLYDRYARAVFSLARRITQDQELAEEITQEAFLRVWRGAASFSTERGRFATWLLSLTHHLAIDQLRRRRARPQVVASTDDGPVQDLLDASIDVEEAVWLDVRRELVQAALTQLPPAQRQVIELAYFRGLTHTEISRLLGDPLGTVKTRLRLGLDKLRGILTVAETGVHAG